MVIISLKGSGDEILFDMVGKIPGAFVHPFPFEVLNYRPATRPDTFDAKQLTDALMDLTNCNHGKLLANRTNWSHKYWFDANPDFHSPYCLVKVRKGALCESVKYLDKTCSTSSIQIFRIRLDLYHGLSLGRLLYDPWISESLRIIYLFRDPRGIVFERSQDPNCNSVCRQAARICSRSKTSLKAAFQFQQFSPNNFK